MIDLRTLKVATKPIIISNFDLLTLNSRHSKNLFSLSVDKDKLKVKYSA